MTTYKLTYFNMRARAEPLRILFALADQKYEDRRVTGEEFAEMRPKLPYDRLPLLEFDDVTLSQSTTIGRFLSNRFGFHGSNDVEAAKIDEIVDACNDYAESFGEYRNTEEVKAKAAALQKVLDVSTPKYFKKFTKVLENNGGKFLVGLKVSYADIILYNTIKFFEVLTGGQSLTKGFPVLQNFVKNFENVPKVRQWIEKRPKTSL